MFYIERMNGNYWQQLCGPFGCEQTAYNYAKGYTNRYKVRIVTNNGSVVNIL